MDVDAVGDLHVIHQMDVDLVALSHPQNRTRYGPTIGPCVVLEAGADFDDLFLDRNREIALLGPRP